MKESGGFTWARGHGDGKELKGIFARWQCTLRMRLSTHLVAVGLAALVPVLGFSALVVRENAQLQLEATERRILTPMS